MLFVLILFIISRKISHTINKNIILALENEILVDQLKGKVEEAINLHQTKSRFLSTMSHEIRTPMNAIIGFIKILQKMEDDPTKNKYLNTIDNSSNLLLNVLNDILDINKIESGKLSIEMKPFNPKQEFEFLFDLYKESCQEKGVHLINSIGDLPLGLENDKLRIKQIITNLLSNALKFTPEGKNIEFIVQYTKEKSCLHIEIKDEGIGIKEENISKVLEEFSQADSSTARKYGGTGLGLSIVSKLLTLLNSKLEVESTYGEGSRFFFEIYVKEGKGNHESKYKKYHVKLEGKKIIL
jgi:signal transduction histidine kinase